MQEQGFQISSISNSVDLWVYDSNNTFVRTQIFHPSNMANFLPLNFGIILCFDTLNCKLWPLNLSYLKYFVYLQVHQLVQNYSFVYLIQLILFLIVIPTGMNIAAEIKRVIITISTSPIHNQPLFLLNFQCSFFPS